MSAEALEKQDNSSRSRDDPGKTCEDVKPRDSREEVKSIACGWRSIYREEEEQREGQTGGGAERRSLTFILTLDI